MSEKITVLVIGGNGFIGDSFIRASAHNYKIYSLSSGSVLSEHDVNGSSRCLGIVRASEIFDQIEPMPDVVLHAAARLIPGTPIAAETLSAYISNDVVSVIDLAIRAKEAGIKRFIYLSSGGALYRNSRPGFDKPYDELDDIEPVSFYGVTKQTVESYIKLMAGDGFSTLSLRLSNPYSGRVKSGRAQGIIPIIINCIMSGEEFHLFGDGSQVRDYIYIDDVVSALQRACEYKGSQPVLNVGTGVGASVSQVINLIEKMTSRRLVVRHLPARSVDKSYAVVSPRLAISELGWNPHVDLLSGIKICVDRFCNKLI